MTVNAAYARRERNRLNKRNAYNKARKEEHSFQVLIRCDKVMQGFEEAFFALYQRRIKLVKFQDGKFRTATATYTEGQLIQLTRSMWAKVHERELGEPE